MDWIILVVAGLFEAVWATALSRSDGLRRPGPVVVFVLGTLVSLGGLGVAMATIPTGTAYAVWAAIGAVATTGWAIGTGAERANVMKVICLVGIVTCVVGLKVLS